MEAGGQDPDPKENQPNKNNTTPQPYTPPPSALQRSRELKDKLKQEIHELEAVIDVQLSAAKEQYQRESAARSSARQRSRRHKPTPIKLPTLDDTMEDHGEQLPEQIGTAVSNAIASTLTKAKEETTGPYISKDAGAHIASDLAKPNRAGFTAEILKKSTLVEGKVKDLMTIKWNNREELSEALKELGLEHVDRRLAATIWCALTDKNKAPTVELLTLMTESDAALGQSGVLLLDWIAKEGIDGAYNKDEKEKALFDATVFFRAGADETINKVGGVKLLKAINVLHPKYHAHGFDSLKLILNKIPSHLRKELWVEMMELDLRNASHKGGEAPWTPQELCGKIAGHLELESAVDERNASVNVGTADKTKYSGTRKTVCCGKATEHAPWDCPHACVVCADHLCPKTHGGICLKDDPSRPTAETLKNAHGLLIKKAKNSDKLIKRAQEVWDKHHPGGGATAHIAVTQTELDEQPLGQQIYVNVVQ